jgi:predicted molibdopterin-dependent oxidoreductase YjgC
MGRITQHPILDKSLDSKEVWITVDGKRLSALEGEPVLAALLAHDIVVQNKSPKARTPRGFFCGIGRCTGCVMMVDGVPNVRTCVVPVREGMVVETQDGLGKWGGAR